MKIKRIRVKFEDHRQDLLWVDIADIVDGVGEIRRVSVSCMMATHLIGTCVDVGKLKVGERLEWFDFDIGERVALKYPIKEIEITEMVLG